MTHPLIFVFVTLGAGWLGLWPVRRRLGAPGYHLAAFPVGLLGWTLVADLSLVLKTGYTAPIAAAGLAIYVAAVWVSARLLPPPTAEEPSFAWWSFGAWAVVLGTATGVLARWGIAVLSFDGWAHYELQSWPLSESGIATLPLLGARMALVPSYHAGYHLIGGEIPTFIYPLLSVQIALLVGYATYRAARSTGIATALGAALAIVVAMVGHVFYLFMSLYVHSHMPTAIYLLLAGIAIWLSSTDVAEDSGTTTRPEHAWLLVAGFAAAGVLLARPDGPAYVAAAIVLYAAIAVRLRYERSSATTFTLPIVWLLGLFTLASIVNQGWWTTKKLNASTLVMFTVAYLGVWLVLRLLPLARLRGLARGVNFMVIVLAIEVVLMALLFFMLPDQVRLTLSNSATNLLVEGGWREFWPIAALMVAVSIVFYVRTGRDRFTSYALFYVAQFFVIALVVHGATHPGRIGWGDSFNRVAFHVVPLMWWYLGMYVAGLLKAVRMQGEDRALS